MRSRYNVICDCGHDGQIIRSENDTPYSNDFWSKISLIDLLGKSGKISEDLEWKDIFEEMKIKCLSCAKQLSEKNLRIF